MFEETTVVGGSDRSIVVQTRTGKNIRNVVELEPGFRELRRYRAILQKYGAHWTERKSPTGQYNCAGHVWASRRTTILDPDQWQLILREDGYRRLVSGQEPLPGDLVLYLDRMNGELIHVGEILRMRSGISPDARIPWVLSKLDSTSGEVMHYVNDLVRYYSDLGFRVAIEYWTDRPREEADQ